MMLRMMMLRRVMNRTIMLMLRKMRWIEDDERKMMVLKMMMWRRTKRIMLRMMMWEEEEENRPQDRDAHFVRACAVEVHFNITLYGNLQVKCRRPTLCASLRSQNALQFIYTEMCR